MDQQNADLPAIDVGHRRKQERNPTHNMAAIRTASSQCSVG
jgi:hypothetical protein